MITVYVYSLQISNNNYYISNKEAQSGKNVASILQVEDNITEINVELLSATTISELDHKLLQKF
ncbi:9867_t:CDS:2 [Racocetra fulgida]|uniref:9867_t:CDS:1 n=1 Tax=Racocetra fulgida TaxID=60492 RepID=A0A9N8ZD87_9GLOM|nr:9867_t:CDS:2 [Racocetra fulgida]